ncbi:uncharacterized protein LOC121382229 [Gigantopelta aegis]|uniref:uncharacterized protein LOC121382229 n=1 Tax=Gigantopelta aegis TaxID=1735272 RepID=UPI001B88AD18|nr:uncharacterized protein LOC121382229 [Gigantopelta aegis]
MSRSRNTIIASVSCFFLVIHAMLRGPNVCKHQQRILQYRMTTSKRKGKQRRKIISFFAIKNFQVCCSGFVKIDNVCIPTLTTSCSTRITSRRSTASSTLTSIGKTSIPTPTTSSATFVNATAASVAVLNVTSPTDSSNRVLQIALPVVLTVVCVAVLVVLGILLKKRRQEKSKRIHHYEQCQPTPISQGHTYYGLETREYAEIDDFTPEREQIAEYADVIDARNTNNHDENYSNSDIIYNNHTSAGKMEPSLKVPIKPNRTAS